MRALQMGVNGDVGARGQILRFTSSIWTPILSRCIDMERHDMMECDEQDGATSWSLVSREKIKSFRMIQFVTYLVK